MNDLPHHSPPGHHSCAEGLCPEGLDCRDRILFAAAKLFADKGFAAASVREIVEAAGVTKPTLYYHFKDKADLYLRIMERAMAEYLGVLDKSSRIPGDPVQGLYTFILSSAKLLRTNVDMVRFVHSAFYGPKDDAPRFDLRPVHERLFGGLGALLQAVADQGGLSPARIPEATHLLVGAMEAYQCRVLKADLGPLPDDAFLMRCVDMILTGARGTG
jgi:TetR/AcrR family transcriptional regulator